MGDLAPQQPDDPAVFGLAAGAVGHKIKLFVQGSGGVVVLAGPGAELGTLVGSQLVQRAAEQIAAVAPALPAGLDADALDLKSAPGQIGVRRRTKPAKTDHRSVFFQQQRFAPLAVGAVGAQLDGLGTAAALGVQFPAQADFLRLHFTNLQSCFLLWRGILRPCP